jgi:hypothetical protein
MNDRQSIGEIKLRSPAGASCKISVDRTAKDVGILFSRSSNEGEALMLITTQQARQLGELLLKATND